MDSVELGRQRAADLHAQAVGRGEDPRRQLAFAQAVALHEGYDTEPTAKGADILEGARATLVSRDRLIVYENDGSDFDKAFLIAHEVGHALLGDDVEVVGPAGIDPARAAEPSPVGFDRVVDYGRHQRREVQMDLFARELLLPRPVLRALHLDDNLTASQIAERFGAPFDVVAQQLFDALLLPVQVTETAKKPKPPLNLQQLEAVRHRGVAYLLEAGPGTGKTETLAGRVESLLADKVDPRRILVLTFSNKAAGEMGERIARIDKDAAAAMWIGTFHAFGLDVVRRFHRELGFPANPGMMDRTEAVELLEDEFPRLGLVQYKNIYDPAEVIGDMLEAVSRAKDEVCGEDRYRELSEDMLRRAAGDADRTTAAEKAVEVAGVYSAYETLKRKANRVDFGDLVMLPVQLLESDDSIRTHFQSLYDHVLVDEYQDVNRSSVRLLSALRPTGENLWAVGDPRQSIYRFRGASSFNTSRFGKEDFPGGITRPLVTNYRSVEEIVDTYGNFAETMAVGGSGRLKANRGPGNARPMFTTYPQADQLLAGVADTIEAMRKLGFRYRDQAVLRTGNEKLAEHAEQLERLGIPVLFLGSLFERAEVKDLLSLLTILSDRRAMGLTRVSQLPEFAMRLEDVTATLDFLKAREGPPATWLRDPSAIESLSSHGRNALAALGRAMEGFDHTAKPWLTLCHLLLNGTRIAARIADSDSVVDRTRGIAIWQLMNFIRVQPGGQGLPINRLLDRIRRLVRLRDERDLRQLPAAAQGLDAVRLSTIHGAKGLEFPVVHLPGLNQDTIPRSFQKPDCPYPEGMVEGSNQLPLDTLLEGHKEEQECLFYVALSRARDRLFLYACTQKSGGASRPLSSFVTRLGGAVDQRHSADARRLPPAPQDAPVAVEFEGAMRFSASEIQLYESCPRRFLYTYVLRTGGRRTSTAFMQTHDVVQEVMQWLLAATEPLDDQAVEAKLHQTLEASELGRHGYVDDFRQLATGMLRYLQSIRVGRTNEPVTALTIRFGQEELTIIPDEVSIAEGGQRTLRKIKTGHKRSKEHNDLAAAAFQLAAQRAFPDAIVELVHLSDEARTELKLGKGEISTRQTKLGAVLEKVRNGEFPTKASDFTCPQCPAFFICGPLPDGVLAKKF